MTTVASRDSQPSRGFSHGLATGRWEKKSRALGSALRAQRNNCW